MESSYPLDRNAAPSGREDRAAGEQAPAEESGCGQSASRAAAPSADQAPAATGWPIATAWDAELGAALRDVPVPSGLSQRLMARLQDPAVSHGRLITTGLGVNSRLAVAGPRRRRWLKAAAAGLACAASIAVAMLYFNQPTAELGGESVMELVRAFHSQQPAAQPLRHDAAPEAYPQGTFVMPGYVVGWFRLASPLLGREGVAYQLTGPRQNRATLYVVDFDGPRSAPRLWLNATSPLENLLTTDGQTSASWTDGARLYVLVADGDEQAFRALVRAPRSMA